MEEKETEPQSSRFGRYWPLACLILIAALAAWALSATQMRDMAWMHYFMGFFLCQFAMLKLFRPLQFIDGFQMYDIVAAQSRVYAGVYPLIELVLGLSYLAFFLPILTYIITIILFGIGFLGVLKALSKGLDVRCACMGTTLDVPLSTVTLTEDIVMIVMAAFLLIK